MSRVYFAPARMKELRAEASLPAKFQRLLATYPMKDMFDGRRVAIKMHLGGDLGYTTIHPLFVRILVKAIKDAGGRPFITDGGGAIPTARHRGYTEEVLEAPVIPAAGLDDGYVKSVPINYHKLKEVQLCGEVVNADAMVVFSHGKGHGHCGWGGAIKNIAMGNVSMHSRGAIHALIDTEFEWDRDRCGHCLLCRDNCPCGALSFNAADEFAIDMHECKYCMHCVIACPHQAIRINQEGIRQFQGGMARVTKACLDTFEPGHTLFINSVINVTPFCDCWGFSSPNLVPDIGIFASTDIVSVEQASIDSVRTEDYIPGSLPPPYQVRDVSGHLFYKIHGKDPYLQCEEAAKVGIGSQSYEITEVE